MKKLLKSPCNCNAQRSAKFTERSFNSSGRIINPQPMSVSTTSCAPYTDEAVISESTDGKKVSATTEMYPPWPYTAFADSLPRFMNNSPGLLIVMFPPSLAADAVNSLLAISTSPADSIMTTKLKG